MDHPVLLSIVLPVYCEADHIGSSLRTIHRVLMNTHETFEIVCVDDGSHDSTWNQIQAASITLPSIRSIKFSRNFGKEGAMLAGLEASCGQAVIVMDCDLQHPPTLIPEMIRIWKEGEFKIVEGVKRISNRRSRVSDWAANIFHSMFRKLTDSDLNNSSDFKLLDRDVVNAYVLLRERKLFFRAMISWMGYSKTQVAFDVADRVGGTSKFSPMKLLRLATGAIISFSPFVLQAATFFGLVLASVASGTSMLASVQLVVGSVILLCLGVIGAYVARIYEELQDRPRYLIEKQPEGQPSLRVFQDEQAA
jgi:polyisoprenyl-phosphate glycosyltransferase